MNNQRRIRTFVRSADLLRRIYAAADGFLMKLCIYHIALSVDERFAGDAGEMRFEMMQDLMDNAPDWTFRPPLRLKADVLALPIPELHRRMYAALSGQLDAIIDVFFRGLHALASAQVLGRVTKLSGEACDFHYFHSIVRGQIAGTEQRSKEISSELLQLGLKTLQKTVRSTHTTHYLTYSFSHARYDVTLFHPRTYRAPAPTVPKPREPGDLIKAAPSWLIPHLRVIEGDQVDALIVQKDLGKKSRQYTVNKRDTYITEIHVDPCITLGPLVLAGWTVHDLGGPKQYRRLRRRARLVHSLRYTGLPALLHFLRHPRRIFRSFNT